MTSQPNPQPASLPQLPALTGLRFFAAFFILFAHSVDWLAQFQNSDIRSQFSFVAMYGMPLFFVLSGFVIHYNYGRLFRSRTAARAASEFAVARFARLFPLYLFLLVVSVIADGFTDTVSSNPPLSARILAYYATLTQSWFYISIDGKELINFLFPLSWSISTEWFFYVAYLAVVYWILSIRSPRASIYTTLIYAAAVIVAFVVVRHQITHVLAWAEGRVPNYVGPEAFDNSFFRWLFYFSPYFRLFEFLMGCLAAHTFILLRGRPVGALEKTSANVILCATLALLGIFGAFYIGAITIPPINEYIKHLALNFLCAPAIGYILFYVGRYDTAFTRLLSAPMLVALGETSYSIYLVHTWTIRIFNRPPQELTLFWGAEAVIRVLCAITFTLLLSYATYRLIETPSRIWLRKRLGGAVSVMFAQAGAADRNRQPAGVAISSPRRQIFFSIAAAGALSSIAIVGQAAESEAVQARLHRLLAGNRSEIEVVSATYGMSCRDFAVPEPFPNAVAAGNVTKPVKRDCDKLVECEFLVDAGRIGDPANSCAKDFVVDYRCAGSSEARSASLPPEANGKSVRLSCAPTPG